RSARRSGARGRARARRGGGGAARSSRRGRWRASVAPRRRGCRQPDPAARGAEERARARTRGRARSEEHTSELQSRENLVCRLLLEKKKKIKRDNQRTTRAAHGRRIARS